MPWNWSSWIPCKGKWPFSNRVSASTTSVSNMTTMNSNSMTKRKKRSKSRSRQSSTNLPELIMQQISGTLKELECPICKSTCVPPIYPCLNGHLLCSSCRLTTIHCPECSEPFSTTRNLFAEQFVLKYAQPCRYSRDGCIFLRWKGCDMKPHEVTCFYRPIGCVVPSCVAPDKGGIPYSALLEHLTDTHKVHGTNRIPTVVNFQTDTLIVDRRWLPYYIKAFGCDFYLMLEARRPHFWAWVWVHPPRLEPSHNNNSNNPNFASIPPESLLSSTFPSLNGYGENFVFISTLVFQNPEKYGYIKWSGPVHSIRTPAYAIIKEGLCFGGSETFMQHFETADQILSLTLNIEKKLLPRNTASNTSSSGGSVTRRIRGKIKQSALLIPTPSIDGAAAASIDPESNLYPPLKQDDQGKGESMDPNSNANPGNDLTYSTDAAAEVAGVKPAGVGGGHGHAVRFSDDIDGDGTYKDSCDPEITSRTEEDDWD